MIADLIIKLFLLNIYASHLTETTLVELPPDVAPSPDLVRASPDLENLVISELACRRDPDPTQVLLAMMRVGLIRAEDRIDFESYSCFPVEGGVAMASLQVNYVCGGVLDKQVNAANPEFYPPNEVIADDDRYQVLALGLANDVRALQAQYANLYGPRADYLSGVSTGLYTPEGANSEIFCDDMLAADLMDDASAGVPSATQ